MAGLGIIKKGVDKLTIDDVIKMFPNKRRTINQKTVDLINNASNDSEFDGHSFKNSLAEYTHIMKRRSGSVMDYVCAVKFVAYVESGHSYIDSYKRTFSHRELVQKAIAAGTDTPEYHSLGGSATRYAKSPMVVDIMTITDVPLYILHQGTRMKAVGVLADEMLNASLSKDRIMAATAILKEIKPPDKIDLGIEIGLSDDAQKQIQSVDDRLVEIAKSQQELLVAGHSISDIQKLNMKKADVEDAELIDG